MSNKEQDRQLQNTQGILPRMEYQNEVIEEEDDLQQLSSQNSEHFKSQQQQEMSQNINKIEKNMNNNRGGKEVNNYQVNEPKIQEILIAEEVLSSATPQKLKKINLDADELQERPDQDFESPKKTTNPSDPDSESLRRTLKKSSLSQELLASNFEEMICGTEISNNLETSPPTSRNQRSPYQDSSPLKVDYTYTPASRQVGEGSELSEKFSSMLKKPVTSVLRTEEKDFNDPHTKLLLNNSISHGSLDYTKSIRSQPFEDSRGFFLKTMTTTTHNTQYSQYSKPEIEKIKEEILGRNFRSISHQQEEEESQKGIRKKKGRTSPKNQPVGRLDFGDMEVANPVLAESSPLIEDQVLIEDQQYQQQQQGQGSSDQMGNQNQNQGDRGSFGTFQNPEAAQAENRLEEVTFTPSSTNKEPFFGRTTGPTRFDRSLKDSSSTLPFGTRRVPSTEPQRKQGGSSSPEMKRDSMVVEEGSRRVQRTRDSLPTQLQNNNSTSNSKSNKNKSSSKNLEFFSQRQSSPISNFPEQQEAITYQGHKSSPFDLLGKEKDENCQIEKSEDPLISKSEYNVLSQQLNMTSKSDFSLPNQTLQEKYNQTQTFNRTTANTTTISPYRTINSLRGNSPNQQPQRPGLRNTFLNQESPSRVVQEGLSSTNPLQKDDSEDVLLPLSCRSTSVFQGRASQSKIFCELGTQTEENQSQTNTSSQLSSFPLGESLNATGKQFKTPKTATSLKSPFNQFTKNSNSMATNTSHTPDRFQMSPYLSTNSALPSVLQDHLKIRGGLKNPSSTKFDVVPIQCFLFSFMVPILGYHVEQIVKTGTKNFEEIFKNSKIISERLTSNRENLLEGLLPQSQRLFKVTGNCINNKIRKNLKFCGIYGVPANIISSQDLPSLVSRNKLTLPRKSAPETISDQD